jgi:hypothetical protein
VSNPASPDSAVSPVRDLEILVHALGDELAAFRKRAQQAEARVKALEAAAKGAQKGGDLFGEQRLHVLEEENNALHARTQHALERIRVLLAQLRFLRQQREQAVQAMSIAES